MVSWLCQSGISSALTHILYLLKTGSSMCNAHIHFCFRLLSPSAGLERLSRDYKLRTEFFGTEKINAFLHVIYIRLPQAEEYPAWVGHRIAHKIEKRNQKPPIAGKVPKSFTEQSAHESCGKKMQPSGRARGIKRALSHSPLLFIRKRVASQLVIQALSWSWRS